MNNINNTINKIGSLRCKACNIELNPFEDVFCQECEEAYKQAPIIIDIDPETEEILYDI